MANSEQQATTPPAEPKRWGRRLLRLGLIVILTGLITIIGSVIWLQQSGQAARMVQDTIQRLSGQDITLGAITFPAWNAIAVSDIRVQQLLPGRQLTITCPRLEARFGLQSLLNKRIASLRAIHPTIRLSPFDGPTPVSDSPSTPIVLPINHIVIENGTVEVQDSNALYVVQHVAAKLTPQADPADPTLQAEIHAILAPDTAQIEMSAQLGLDGSTPSGTGHLTIKSEALPQLIQTVGHLLPPTWSFTQGSLQADANLTLAGQVVQGTIQTHLTQVHGQLADMTLQAATLTSDTTLDLQIDTRTLSLNGPLQLQAEKLDAPAKIVATHLQLNTPLNLDITPESWKVETDLNLATDRLTTDGAVTVQQLSSTGPLTVASAEQGWKLQGNQTLAALTAGLGDGTNHLQLSKVKGQLPLQMHRSAKAGQSKTTFDITLQSRTLTAGKHLRAKGLTTRIPLTLTPSQSETAGWKLAGTATLNARTLTLGSKAANQVTFDNVQSRLPLQMTATMLNLKNAQLQTQSFHIPVTKTTTLQSPLDLRITTQLDFKRQQLHLQQANLTLPDLGHLSGHAKWQWAAQVVRDANLEVNPTSVDALWTFLKPLLPPPYPEWIIDGQTRLEATLAHGAWNLTAPMPKWTLHWHFDNIAFSSPEGDRAGEHLSGELKTTISIETNPKHFIVDGSLHLTPFSLLIGTFFPALEDQLVSSAIDFTSAYYPDLNQLNLQLDGQFGNIGQISLQGSLQQPPSGWRYSLTGTLHRLNTQVLYQVLLPPAEADGEAAPTLTMDSTLTARLKANGQSGSTHLQGDLDFRATHLQTGTTKLEGVQLKLPLDLRYPLPQSRPNQTSLPASAIGSLTIERAQASGLLVRGIHTPVLMQSDSILFPEDIDLSLLQGRMILKQFKAYHLLQEQRHIQLGLQLRALNLEAIQRGTSKLPVAGSVNADFPRIEIKGQTLETDGDLTLQVADGNIRLDSLQGQNIFTRFPTLRASARTEKPLSLLQLTQIYPIGDIGGTLHFTLDDLAITALEPESFHLIFKVQEKRGEKREIALRALNNLLFTTGSAKVDADQAYRLPYKRFGADITLKHDTLRLRGLYHDNKGHEYFMRAPLLGGGVSIINRVPKHGVAFRSFLQRLKATVLDKPAVNIK